MVLTMACHGKPRGNVHGKTHGECHGKCRGMTRGKQVMGTIFAYLNKLGNNQFSVMLELTELELVFFCF